MLEESLIDEIPRLRRQVNALKEDVRFVESGGTIHYACDFSELHDYLNNETADFPVKENSSRLFDDSQAAKLAGLLAFFNDEKLGSIILLPPHTKELWAFIRKQKQKHSEIIQLNRKFLDQLTEEEKQLIQEIAKGSVKLADIDKLLPTILAGAEGLCTDIATLINELLPSNARARLKALLESKHVVYQLENIFENTSSRPPKNAEIDEREVMTLLKMFPDGKHERPRMNKINDCKALLYLRKINNRLANKKQKILFLTRDRSIRKLVYEMSKNRKLNWPDAHSYVRTMTGLQYYLHLASLESSEEKFKLLDEADHVLDEVECAINQKEHAQNAKLLDRALENLRSHLTIQLSISLRDIWSYRESKFKRRSDSLEATDLQNSFATILRSKEYQNLLIEGAERTWDTFQAYAIAAFFDHHLQHTDAQSAIDLITSKNSDELIIASVRSGVALTVNFKNPKLSQINLDLHSASRKDKNLGRLISEAIGDVASGALDAEGFLFMGFIFCLNKHWDIALKLLNNCYSHSKNVEIKCEALYLSSFARRRLARRDRKNGLRHLKEAFKHIQEAIEISREGLNDARLAMELASISILYYKYSKDEGREIIPPIDDGGLDGLSAITKLSQIHPRTAIELLSHGLEQTGENTWLRIAILNNLAYSSYLGDHISLDAALECCNTIRAIFEKIRQHPRIGLPLEPWNSLQHTMIVVEAMRAYRDHDINLLHRLINELEDIAKNKNTSENDRYACHDSISQIDVWRNNLSKSDVLYERTN